MMGMVSQLTSREAEAVASKAALKRASEKIDQLKSDLEQERNRYAALGTRLNDSKANLSRMKGEKEQKEQKVKNLEAELSRYRSSWSGRLVHAIIQAASTAGNIVPRQPARSKQVEEMVKLVTNSRLFDRHWYLACNQDVASEGVDPALHYILHGAAEGRDPGPDFSTHWYLDTYPDVADAGVNPLIHYLVHGREEGRETVPSSINSKPSAITGTPIAAADPVSFPVPQPVDIQWVRQKDFTSRHGDPMLELSGCFLGAVTMMDEGDEQWQTFSAQLQNVMIFCWMTGIDARRDLLLRKGEKSLDITDKFDAVQVSAVSHVLNFGDAEKIVAFADIWFANDRDLRFRFSTLPSDGVHPHIIRFFQYNPSRRGALQMLAESVLWEDGMDFVDVALWNPYMPLLISVTTSMGRLKSISVLPFPSLCRGGVHYGELCAVGTGASYVDDLRVISKSLLGEMLGGITTSPNFSVARIGIELQGATGAERIFSREIREWLSAIMHINVAPVNHPAISDAKMYTYLEEVLASSPPVASKNTEGQIASRDETGRFELTLAADTIPSIHALVSCRIGIPVGRQCAVGSFVVTDDKTAKPKWMVKVPPMGGELVALQPVGSGTCYPVLTRLLQEEVDDETGETADFPLTVRFRDTGEPHEARLVMPVAPEAPGALLRRGLDDTLQDFTTISVLLPFYGRTKAADAALLESLQCQTLADRINVVAIADASHDEVRAEEEILQRFFPRRYLFIRDEEELCENARINLAASRATGKFLLFACEDIILHDPRTLECLCVVADHDRAASASCILIKETVVENSRKVVFHSGGIFPSSPAGTELIYSEPDCYNFFPVATYPVAGNSSALFMARADVWRKMKGFDAIAFPDDRGDIDYGFRAEADGFFHLCTSVVSVGIHKREASIGLYVDAEPPRSLSGGDYQKIASSACFVETLKV